VLPDVQFLKPEIPIKINRVGAKGVRKLVKVNEKDGNPIILISNFDVFIDLPPDMKGANLSRNFEVIDEVIEELTSKPVKKIEELCLSIAEILLKRHEYATRSEVYMNSELIIRKETPITNQVTQEVVKIICEAICWKDGVKNVLVGAEVTGFTVCPCAQELIKVKAIEELKKIGFNNGEIKKILETIPIPSHNQRGRAMIKIQVTKDFSPSIDELIQIAKRSMSMEIYEVLKREDELKVVWDAHKNPRFVEDCVRLMAKLIVETFKDAPDNVIVILRQENEESIHQHNVLAERIATIGELRKELSKNSLN